MVLQKCFRLLCERSCEFVAGWHIARATHGISIYITPIRAGMNFMRRKDTKTRRHDVKKPFFVPSRQHRQISLSRYARCCLHRAAQYSAQKPLWRHRYHHWRLLRPSPEPQHHSVPGFGDTSSVFTTGLGTYPRRRSWLRHELRLHTYRPRKCGPVHCHLL